jgi:hypothetical protein
MSLRHTLSLPAALCCLASLCGCVIGVASRAPQDTTKFTVENTERFAVMDAAAQADISCTGLQERTLGDGRLEVVANVRNRGENPARLQVECEFQDGNGMPVAAASPGQALTIGALSTEVVRFAAPGTDAVRYTIRVRTAR